MDTTKKTSVAKHFELISIPNSPSDPTGPATLYKVPKDLIMSYIKMTRELREQFETISSLLLSSAMLTHPTEFIKLSQSDSDEIPDFLLEILAQPEIKIPMDNLTTKATIEYRDFWGHDDFLKDYGVTNAEEIRELTEGMEWHTWQPNSGWSEPASTDDSVDIHDDGTVRIKLNNLTKGE